eukprot:1662413-Karenia_brevis.AAC.1
MCDGHERLRVSSPALADEGGAVFKSKCRKRARNNSGTESYVTSWQLGATRVLQKDVDAILSTVADLVSRVTCVEKQLNNQHLTIDTLSHMLDVRCGDLEFVVKNFDDRACFLEATFDGHLHVSSDLRGFEETQD